MTPPCKLVSRLPSPLTRVRCRPLVVESPRIRLARSIQTPRLSPGPTDLPHSPLSSPLLRRTRVVRSDTGEDLPGSGDGPSLMSSSHTPKSSLSRGPRHTSEIPTTTVVPPVILRCDLKVVPSYDRLLSHHPHRPLYQSKTYKTSTWIIQRVPTHPATSTLCLSSSLTEVSETELDGN